MFYDGQPRLLVSCYNNCCEISGLDQLKSQVFIEEADISLTEINTIFEYICTLSLSCLWDFRKCQLHELRVDVLLLSNACNLLGS